MNGSPRILIVDDEPMMTQSLEAVLGQREYSIETTNSSTNALNKLKEGDYDLAMLDVMMPEMGGFQIMDSLDRENMETMFIIMTGEASMESAIEAVRKGANDYIRKPFEPDELFIRVDNILKQKQLKDERKQSEIEKKNLENQLRQSQKMEAIGTLAGGIAHDFNNMLGIIIGNAELALDATPESNPVHQNIKRILTASTRAEDMINRLLSFSRKSEAEKKPIILNSVIQEALKLIRSSIPANIEIKENIPDDFFTIFGDPTQINQIILNLCTNAAHAMQQSGGTLYVSLEKHLIAHQKPSAFCELPPGDYCLLTVEDTGHGINNDIIDRIFDPYFTTKGLGKGTGMGLAVVHGIVKKHKGDIKVNSKPGKGTKFFIYLPEIEEAVFDTIEKEDSGLPMGMERILLVDDEEMIVDIMQEMLEQLGYNVTAAKDSKKALDSFHLDPMKYDLLITDMSMPNLTGDCLAKKIKDIRTDIPIIICTGYNEKINDEEAMAIGVQELIMKPVSMNKLARTIRNVFDNPIDRRGSKRFTAISDTFVISNFKGHEKYSLIDISKSGLAFRYGRNGNVFNGSGKLSLTTGDDKFIVHNIKCQTVSDINIHEASTPSDAQIKRRGIRFEKLSPVQSEMLDYFIKNYTSGSFEEQTREIQ